MLRRLPVVIVLSVIVLLCVTGAGVTAEESPGSIAAGDTREAVDARSAVAVAEFDRTIVSVTVSEDASARWTFQYERSLADEDERDEFETFAAEFRDEETELYENFRRDSRDLVATGDDLTDREMRAEAFDRDAYVRSQLDNDIGVVEMTFTWQGFARQEEGRVIAGDVFEGGLYLGSKQVLVVHPGDGLAFERVDPEGTQSNPDSLAESSSVTYEGERQFTDRRPRVVFQPTTAAGGTPTVTPSPTPSTSPTPAPGNDRSSPVFPSTLLWLLIAAAILGAVGIAWRSDVFGRDHTSSSGESAAAIDDPSPESAAIPAPELKSDEDRIVELLEENGGRVKQAQIVEHTDWSKSKVSVLLSEMEAEGTISKLRVGRENVVSLDGHEPEASRSPLDDE